MPRKYKRKTERNKIDTVTILEAVKEVRQPGIRLSKVALDYNINQFTLKYYVNKYKDKNLDNEDEIEKLIVGKKTILGPKLEKELVSYILSSARTFLGLTPTEIRKLAFELAVANESIGTNVPETWQKNRLAGKDWFTGVMKRNNDQLSIRKPEATSFYRVSGFNHATVDMFFANFGAVIHKFGFRPSNIYNMDETAMPTVHKPVNIVAQKGEKQVGATTTEEKGELVTLAATVSAAGIVLPPFFIFPRVRFHSSMLADAPAGSDGTSNPNGWMKKETFLEYLKHFVKHSRCSVSKTVLLILDNHVSHVLLEAIKFAKENGIVLLTIPPHTTHKLQPLDVSLFEPLKTAKNTAGSEWVKSNPRLTMKITHIPKIYSDIYEDVFSIEKIKNAFKKCGICPWNKFFFKEKDFAPSTVLDRPLVSTSDDTEVQDPEFMNPPKLITPAMLRPIVEPAPRTERSRKRKSGKTAILTDSEEIHQMKVEEEVKSKRIKKKAACSNMEIKKEMGLGMAKGKKKKESVENKESHQVITKEKRKRKVEENKENHIPKKKNKCVIKKIENLLIKSENEMNSILNVNEKSGEDISAVENDSVMGKRKRKKNSKYSEHYIQ